MSHVPGPLATFPQELTVSDLAIHPQDVRRPLGLDGALDDQVLRTTLDFLTTHKMVATPTNRPDIEGVQLTATDIDGSFGQRAEISGPAEALVMGLAARPVLDELTGDGLSKWG